MVEQPVEPLGRGCGGACGPVRRLIAYDVNGRAKGRDNGAHSGDEALEQGRELVGKVMVDNCGLLQWVLVGTSGAKGDDFPQLFPVSSIRTKGAWTIHKEGAAESSFPSL